MVPHDYYPQVPDGMRVITLASSNTPMPLHVPFVHEIEGFTVFRSQSEVVDSTLYYLHVGYFANDAIAREALLVIRKYYPFAMIEPVPDAAMGSLDDTMTAEFRVLREAAAHVVARREIPHHAVARKPTQYFAVLLQRRESPAEAKSIPRLPEFRGLHVYGVRASHDGGECQDIRLGFFRDLQRARAFADAIRAHYPKAAVLPVSKREHARVTGLVQQSSPVVHSTRTEPPKPAPVPSSPSDDPAAELRALVLRTSARG
jgi:hypothetical protein